MITGSKTSSQSIVYGLAVLTLGGVALTGLLLFRTMSDREDPGPDATQVNRHAVPASLAGFEDSGTFSYYEGGDSIAACEFEWAPSGTYRSTARVDVAGSPAEYRLSIDVDSQGIWTRIFRESPSDESFSYVRGDGFVRRTFAGRRDYLYPDAGSFIIEDWSPALYSVAVSAIDSFGSGERSLPVLLVPGWAGSAGIRRGESRDVEIAGRNLQLREHIVELKDGMRAEVWSDERHRIYLCRFPHEDGLFVRQGFEELARILEAGDS